MAVDSSGDICTLPEDHIAAVLSLTSPKDAGRLSVVASTFRSASQSDAVWDRFLPSDYRDIISRAVDGDDSLLAKFHSKKDLYLHLCDHPILIDEGRKSFSLEKSSGKKCYMLAARDLGIDFGFRWAGDIRYGQWISVPESRFPEVGELGRVCQLEIHGKMNVNMLSSGTNYAAYLVFSCNLGNYYGFEHNRAQAFVGISGREWENRMMVWLHPKREQDSMDHYTKYPRWAHFNYPRWTDTKYPKQRNDGWMDQNIKYPKQRNDRWMEVELGEYFVQGGEDGDFEVRLKLLRGVSDWSGLIVQGIEIRPKRE